MLIASGSPYHKRPNGSTSEIRSTPHNQPQQKNENKKYDNSTLRNINRPVAFAACFPSYPDRARLNATAVSVEKE